MERRLGQTTDGSRRGKRRTARSLLAAGIGAFAMVAQLLTYAQPAAAATPLAPMDVKGMKLTAREFDQRWKAIDLLRQDPAIHGYPRDTPALSPMLDGHGWTGRPSMCHKSNIDPKYSPDGFCWTPEDDASGEWTPQGLTGSHDAQPGGTWNGKHVYLASWHSAGDRFSRISVVENTGSSTVYQHILLVDPYLDGAGANFRAVGDPSTGPSDQEQAVRPGGHADGIAWYGNKLFLATGHQIQVYDLRNLIRITENDSAEVGLHDGKATARYHNWALPMIGMYTNAPAGAKCTDTAPCLTSLSLDRTGADTLVTSEVAEKGGRPVVQWPLHAGDGLLDTDGADNHSGSAEAAAAWRVPIWKVQGAATDGTYWYFSGECPETAGTDDSDVPYCIHRALPGEEPHVLTKAPPLTQNLSFAPSSGRLWGINERAWSRKAGAQRVVFSLDPPA